MFHKTYDVAVCGGGVAGCAAAIAAARRGMKTILIENTIMPGGLATSGLVLVYLPLCDGNGHQVVFGLSETFLRIANTYGPQEVNPRWQEGNGQRLVAYFSPASFVLALDEVLVNHEVDLWFDTKIIGAETDESSRVTAVQVANKSGIGTINAKVFIDATGDADVVNAAGGACLTAKNSLVTWVIEHREGKEYSYPFGKDVSTLISANPLFWNDIGPGINGKIVSQFVLDSRKKYLDALKADYQAGKASRMTRYPLTLPCMVPMRHSRCIKGLFTLEPGMEQTHFQDSIGLATDWRKANTILEVPYRSLLPEKLTGVLAAGRCTSAQDDAWEITRVIPNAAMTGEAAGTAAALAIQNQQLPHELNVEKLQDDLREQGNFKLHREEINL